MATIRAGRKSALLVVDVQQGVMLGTWETDRVVRKVERTVARAREAGLPVLWIQHADDELVHGSPAWQWVPELVPAPAEARIDKRFNSAFEETALEPELARLGVTHLVLAGAATNWCIRATGYAALERGYDLSLVADAHTTADTELGGGRVTEARQLVDDLNLAMTWLRYPGRANRAVPLEELDFTLLDKGK